MALKTIQVADKPTLDYIFNKLSNYKSVGISVVENDLESFTEYVNVSISTLPYDFFTFLFPFAPNKKYYMARWRGDSILVFDDEQKILNSDDCQVLVANHDLVFTGVYDYKKGVVKIKDQAFFDNIKIDKWDFWAVYKYKIKSDILKLSDLKR